MSEPTHDREPEGKQRQPHTEEPLRRTADPDVIPYRPDDGWAVLAIEEILTGKGHPAHLPEYVSVLGAPHRADVVAKRARLKNLPGDIALHALELAGADVQQTLEIALNTSSPATFPALRAYLEHESGEDLAKLSSATARRLRDVAGAKFLSAMPRLNATQLADLAQQEELVRWFVETTEPGVCAHMMATALSLPMAATLDRLKLWDTWVDKLRPTDVTVNVKGAAWATDDPHAKRTLTALLGDRIKMSEDELAGDKAKHKGALHAELAGTPTVRSLLEAIGRETIVATADAPKLYATLEKLHATADDLLGLSSASGLDRRVILRLLLRAPGVTPQHVTRLLDQGEGGLLLFDPGVRLNEIRAAAPELRLQDLMRGMDDELHDKILETPGFADWYLAGANARDKLWFCTQNLQKAKKAIRLVGNKIGFGWVHELTSMGADHDTPLRILMMNIDDTDAKTYVKEVLLGQFSSDEKQHDKASVKIDASARGGEGARLVESLDGSDDVLERLGDLDDAKRARLGKDEAVAVSIAAQLTGDQFARAAHYLDLSFAHTVAACPARSSLVVAYLARRPHAEQLEALGRPELVKRAAEKVHPNLLAVFPALGEPAVLAGVLGRDAGALALLVEGSDPDRVVDAISREPALAKAEAIFEKQSSLAAKLPRYKHMTKDSRAAIDRLAKGAAADSGAREAFEDVQSGAVSTESGARRRERRLDEAAKEKTLVEAIEGMGKKHDKAMASLDKDRFTNAGARKDETELASLDALTLLHTRRDEVPALLTDRLLKPAVDKLAAMIDLPPNVAVPWIGTAELVRMPNALHWWTTFRDPTILLQELAGSSLALRLICVALSNNTLGALAWLRALPKGHGLDAAERKTLDQMRPLVTDPAAKAAVFEARFGMPPPGEWDTKTLDALYDLVARLPPGHVLQGHTAGFSQRAIKPASGQYVVATHTIEIDPTTKPDADTDEFYSEEMQQWRTLPQMQAVYGYDETRLAGLQAAGRVITKDIRGVTHYQLKVQDIDLFTQTVLHEIGHSVDEQLGSHTSVVFDFAGWHDYNDATFDEWAGEMGGWDKVSGPDKEKIKEAWITATRAHAKVKEIVPSDHVALSKDYEDRGVNLVKSARRGDTFSHISRVQHGDRIFIAGSYPQKWSSVHAATAASAPSQYSLYAPVEYFAESYVEYYRGVDGKPGSEGRKGGALAQPVKQWFDENVDKVRFDPGRFKNGGGGEGGADAKPTKQT